MFRTVIRLACLAGMLAVFPAVAVTAPADAGGDTKKTDTPADRIKKALDQPTDLDVSDQPLPLAIAQLREQTKINFVIDRQAIANMGIDPDSTPINVKLQNVKLRAALRTLLGQYSLTYAVIGDTVVITSEEMAMYRQLRQRVSVDLDRVQLVTALKQLSRETSTNLVIDPRVHKESQTPVTLQLEDVPLETAVRLLAEMAGLRPVRMGNVMFVTTKANATELRQDPDLFPQQPGQVEGQFFIPGVGGIPKIGIVPPAPAVPGLPDPAAPPVPLPPQEDKRPDGTAPPKPPER
jgi:hypothetical protein